MDLVTRAIIFAANAHDGMRRKKENIPYIMHPAEAAVIVSSLTENQEVIAAALLHDVIEDTPVSFEDVVAEFGPRVAALVWSESEDKREGQPPAQTWRARKEESIEIIQETKDLEVKMVFLGDKLANMRSFYRQWKAEGEAMWQGYNQTDPAQHAWYYRSIADALSEFKETPAWQEYNALIKAVFGEE